MTYPWPDPNPHPSGPTGPRTYSVPLKSCCPDLIVGEECGCDEFYAEMVAAMRSPLYLSFTRDKQEARAVGAAGYRLRIQRALADARKEKT